MSTNIEGLASQLEEKSKIISELQESKQSLEESNDSKAQQIEALHDKCKTLEEANQLKDNQVQSLEEEARKFKLEVDESLKELGDRNNWLKLEYEQQLAASETAHEQVNEKVVLLEKENAAKEEVSFIKPVFYHLFSFF